MLASSASPRWPLLLVVALFLLQAQLAQSATFHLLASSPPGATFDGTPYSSSYDLMLTGVEAPPGSGTYNITGVSGTRTYDNGADAVTTVNVLPYTGVDADNILYFTKLTGGFLDENGLGG